ncbi:MAG TPA: PA14 domain-containing protein [Anaerolineae bacterium]|nr:PA14 domain-containing protein [Anaerolineae bacterium]
MSRQYSYPDQDPQEGPLGYESEVAGSSATYLLLVLALVAAIVLCVAGFFVARLLIDREPADLPGMITDTAIAPTTQPGEQVTVPVTVPPGTPGQAALAIAPQQGYINTLISVAGRDWWPGEPVFVFLRAPSEAGDRGYAYAAAVADDDGNMRAAFTFPNEMRWIGESWAEVIARGSRSGMEATARFDLVVPTAMPTSEPPTPLPTRPATESPEPTSTGMATESVTSTPTPTFAPVITDWLGEYFAGTSPGGTPAFIRNDLAVDFNWGEGSPDPRLPNDGFSARWTRQVQFLGGYYQFRVSSDDGVRLWIDGQLMVDQWHDGVLEDYTLTVYLSQAAHSLRLEYYENLGGAMVSLSWSQASPPTATHTPSATPSATPTNTPAPTEIPTQPPPPTPEPTVPPAPGNVLPDVWRGEYYNNPLLSARPVLVRSDSAINFDWGTGAPEGLPPDGFSVRWTGEQWLSSGTYDYVIAADDGARLWIDGNLVVDAWLPSGGNPVQGSITLGDGVHSFVVEYFEVIEHARITVGGARR